MSDYPSPSRGFPAILAGLIGFVIGGLLAGGVSAALLVRMKARHEADLAALAVANEEVGDARKHMPAIFDMRDRPDASAEERTIMKLGKDFVEDLEANRLAAAYRMMSAEYQKKTERKMFDEMVTGQASIRNMIEYDRKEKARRIAEGKWDFYCTGNERNSNNNKVNFTLTFVRDKDDWRVDELEIIADSAKKK